MSKAFTREDDQPDEYTPLPARSALPPGVRNYITTAGAQRLREELTRLIEIERPNLSQNTQPETLRQRQLLDQRIDWLHQSLQSAVVVDPAQQPADQVRFGASVTVRSRSGEETSYRLVGVDETDIDRGWISWMSPIAKALLNARVGQRIRLRLPAGEDELEILRIAYE